MTGHVIFVHEAVRVQAIYQQRNVGDDTKHRSNSKVNFDQFIKDPSTYEVNPGISLGTAIKLTFVCPPSDLRWIRVVKWEKVADGSNKYWCVVKPDLS